MRESVSRWPQVGRAFLRRRASWFLSGLFAFSFVLAGAAGALYLSAVPSLAAVSPFAQQFADSQEVYYNPFGPLASTSASEGGEVEGSAGGLALSPDESAESAALLSLGAAAAGNEVSGVDMASPLPSFSVVSPHVGNTSGSKGDDASSPGGGAGNASGSSGSSGASAAPDTSGSSAASGSSAPSSESSSGSEKAGLDEAMEGRIRGALVESYNEMLGYANRVFEEYNAFYSLTLNASKDECLQAARSSRSLCREVEVANAAWPMKCGEACGLPSGIYADSRYLSNYGNMQHAYGALISSLYQLDNAWSAYINSADPASNVDAWSSLITLDSSGQVKALAEYESYRAGACP